MKKSVYEKYNLKKWSDEEKEILKLFSPKQYEQLQKREYLIAKGKYRQYKRDIALNNLYNVLFLKKTQYGNIIKLDNETIDISYIIFKLRNVRPSYLDNLFNELSLFIETYSEQKQKRYDFEQLKNLEKSLNVFLENPKIKLAKTFRYKHIVDKAQEKEINKIFLEYNTKCFM